MSFLHAKAEPHWFCKRDGMDLVTDFPLFRVCISLDCRFRLFNRAARSAHSFDQDSFPTDDLEFRDDDLEGASDFVAILSLIHTGHRVPGQNVSV